MFLLPVPLLLGVYLCLNMAGIVGQSSELMKSLYCIVAYRPTQYTSRVARVFEGKAS